MKAKNYILLVVNPIAGDCEKQPIIGSVQTETERQKINLEIYRTTGGNDKEAIEQIINEFSPYRVIVAGGDGTISLVAHCIYGRGISLGIIPAGSANGMALNLKLPDVLSEQIKLALSPTILDIDILFINGRPCLHIADLGLNAELIRNYEESGIRGKMGYLLQSIPTLFRSEYPFEFSIETSGETREESGVLLAIANANKFGTGATINPTGKINDGKFEILVFKNLDFFEIIKTVQDAPQMSPDFVSIICTSQAKITCNNSVPFQIDGEFLGEVKSIDVNVGKDMLSVAVPKEFIKLQN